MHTSRRASTATLYRAVERGAMHPSPRTPGRHSSPPKAPPSARAVEAVKAAAAGRGVHGGKGAPLQVLHRPQGVAAPSSGDDRSHHASRCADGQTRDDSAGNGDAERGAEEATPQERVLRPMQVLDADAVDVVE